MILKLAKRAEQFEDDYQNRQGKPLDALWGLKNEGFFMDELDIANYASQTFGQVKPGTLNILTKMGMVSLIPKMRFTGQSLVGAVLHLLAV